MLDWGTEYIFVLCEVDDLKYAHPKWMEQLDGGELLCFAMYWFERASVYKKAEAYYWLGEACNLYRVCNVGAQSYVQLFWDNAKANPDIQKIIAENPDGLVSRVVSWKDDCSALSRQYFQKSAGLGNSSAQFAYGIQLMYDWQDRWTRDKFHNSPESSVLFNKANAYLLDAATHGEKDVVIELLVTLRSVTDAIAFRDR